jgi:hypothetical protein
MGSAPPSRVVYRSGLDRPDVGETQLEHPPTGSRRSGGKRRLPAGNDGRAQANKRIKLVFDKDGVEMTEDWECIHPPCLCLPHHTSSPKPKLDALSLQAHTRPPFPHDSRFFSPAIGALVESQDRPSPLQQGQHKKQLGMPCRSKHTHNRTTTERKKYIERTGEREGGRKRRTGVLAHADRSLPFSLPVTAAAAAAAAASAFQAWTRSGAQAASVPTTRRTQTITWQPASLN